MRAPLIAAAFAVAMLTAGAAAAQSQDQATAGQYRADLVKVMDGLAIGECPEDVMKGELLTACEEQMTSVTDALAMLGQPSEISFVRSEGEGTEMIEIYQASYPMGVTLTWGIGGVEDGRYTKMYVTSD